MGKVIEDEHYYNNRYIVVDDIVEFERVYMVDENKFDNGIYEALGKVYESLPYYLGNLTHLLSISDFLQWELLQYSYIRKIIR